MLRVLGVLILWLPGLAWAQAREVSIPEAGGLALRAALYLPAGLLAGFFVGLQGGSSAF